jgi:FkbM family methyltransferase
VNIISQFIQKRVIHTKAEEVFVYLRRASNSIRKIIPVKLRNKFPSIGRFIPASASYPKDDCYLLTRDNTHFKINRSDYVQWRVFYGVRDNALAAAKRFVTKESVVLDIGANFGAFSLKLASFCKEKNYPAVQIHAFEPNSVVFENYQNNLELNPELKNIIRLHPIGLGNETGERSFHYENLNTGAGRIVQDSAVGQLKIRIQRLDDFVNELNPANIAFIKLIVEGFEPEVFKGGWNTIQKYRPPIFFEVTEAWWKENNSTIEEVLGKLRKLGYRFEIEHYNEMLPYEPQKYTYRTQFNLLATISR